MDDPLDPEEVRALYTRYGFLLLRRCRMILKDSSQADDALQEAFVKILRSGGAVRAADEPLRWLYRVVDRCCFDALRRRRRSIETATAEELPGPVHPGVAIEVRDAVLLLLSTMTEQEMQIALRLFVDGMSQGEIADDIGLSRVTVNKKVQAIRARADAVLGQARPVTP